MITLTPNLRVQPGENCSICQEDFTLLPAYAHASVISGRSSPALVHNHHWECITNWVKRKPTCPECRAPIDPSSVLTRIERVADAFIHSLPSAVGASAFALTVGLLGAALTTFTTEKSPLFIASVIGTILFESGEKIVNSLFFRENLAVEMKVFLLGALSGSLFTGVAECDLRDSIKCGATGAAAALLVGIPTSVFLRGLGLDEDYRKKIYQSIRWTGIAIYTSLLFGRIFKPMTYLFTSEAYNPNYLLGALAATLSLARGQLASPPNQP